MSSPCWSLPHLLSHSLLQHEAPLEQHELFQEHSTHPAQLLHHDLLRERPEAHPAPLEALTRSGRTLRTTHTTDYRPSADALVSFQRLQGTKVYSKFRYT